MECKAAGLTCCTTAPSASLMTVHIQKMDILVLEDCDAADSSQSRCPCLTKVSCRSRDLGHDAHLYPSFDGVDVLKVQPGELK